MNNATVSTTDKAAQLSMFINDNIASVQTKEYGGRDWFFLGERSLMNNPTELARFDVIYKGVEQAVRAANERSKQHGLPERKVIIASHNNGDIVIGTSVNALLAGHGRTLKFSLALPSAIKAAGTPTAAASGVMV